MLYKAVVCRESREQNCVTRFWNGAFACAVWRNYVWIVTWYYTEIELLVQTCTWEIKKRFVGKKKKKKRGCVCCPYQFCCWIGLEKLGRNVRQTCSWIKGKANFLFTCCSFNFRPFKCFLCGYGWWFCTVKKKKLCQHLNVPVNYIMAVFVIGQSDGCTMHS